jgi:hypothetical protein|nr:MAG TPA: hypothetical protein [Bacteriophage sp.]
MKKIINIDRKPIVVDTDTAEVKAINRSTRGIDDIYIIPEDAHIEWTSKFFPDKTIEVDAKKNDILVTFYDRDLGTDFVIVKSEDWLNALNNAASLDQKRKEEWAAKQKESVHTNTDCGDACCESR